MVKYRIVFEAESNKKNLRVLKLNVSPSKNQGFTNFINQCVKEDKPISIYFEKIDGDNKEKSKIKGTFRFQA